MRPGRRLLPCLVLLAAVSAVASVAPAGAAPPRLGPVVRVETPGQTRCPSESEPEVLVTRAGTWIAYNDMHQCWMPVDNRMTSAIAIQLLPAGGGPPRFLRPEPSRPESFHNGDPALAPDPSGDGVILASLQYTGWYDADESNVELYRISPSMKATPLGSPSNTASEDDHADKELVASDTGPRSRYRGRVYVVWDGEQGLEGRLMFRAYDGRRWLPAVALGRPGKPDVAVAPNGDVAVAWEVAGGVAVRISKDGGATFSPERLVIAGQYPGRHDPSCPLFSVVGTRQRVTKATRATYDAAGRLHVVASVGRQTWNGLPPPPPVGVAGDDPGRIAHAVTRDGRTWTSSFVDAESPAVRFHSAVAPVAGGGVAVAWLEETTRTTFDAYVAVAPPGRAFGRPIRVSPRSASFVLATEAQLTTGCYGIGDYIGLAETPRGVVVAWPTTDAAVEAYDTDVLVREVYVR